jgi:hypothetical protein
MARLSDFQKPVGAFVVDPLLMSRNTFDAGNSVDWETTEIGTPKGGTLGGHDDPFKVLERAARRSVATDKERSRRQRLHDAPDRLLGSRGEENPEPASEKVHIEADKKEIDDAKLHAMLDAIMNSFSATERTATDRDYGRDAKAGKPCCFDCGNLDGVVAVNRQHCNKVV